MRVFAVLADPVRFEIVAELARRDLTAGQIASRFPIARPAVSRHLGVLRKARLVSVTRSAQRRIYRLNPAGLLPAEKWLEQCRRSWRRRLDALGRHLDYVAASELKKVHR